MKLSSPNPTLRHLWRALFLSLALGVASAACAAQDASPPPALPRLVISPVIPPGPDDGLELGRTLADLLAVQLSSSDRWTLVERAQLATIEDEWLLKGSDLAGRAASLRLGNLSRADLVLECRVSSAVDENPTATFSVVETARAELIATSTARLSGRPSGPWYRSPPDADAAALGEAARGALDQACARLAGWRGRPVAALLFSETGNLPAPETEEVLARLATAAGQAGSRWVDFTPGRASEAEGLLALQGFTDAAASPWSLAADLYVWMQSDADGVSVSTWRPGLEVRKTALKSIASDASAPALASLIQAALADAKTSPGVEFDAGRRAVAKNFLAEARRLWGTIGKRDNVRSLELENWRKYPPEQQPVLAQIRALLNAAGFFALEDAEIQELRIAVSARLASDMEKPLLIQRYCEMADRFWIRPDGTRDARLCVDSHLFRFIPFSFEKRRIPQTLAGLDGLPDEALPAFAPMLEAWVRSLCGYGKDEASLALLEQVWPYAARALGERVHLQVNDTSLDLVSTVRYASPAWGARVASMLARSDALTRRPAPAAASTPLVRSSPRATLMAAGIESAQKRRQISDTPGAARRGPTPPAPGAPAPSVRPSLPPLLAAAAEKKWAELDRSLDAKPDLSLPSGLSTEFGDKTTLGQELLRMAAKGGRIELANRLLDARIEPVRSEHDSSLSALVQRAGRLSDSEIALVRRLIDAGDRLGAKQNPYDRVFERHEFWLGTRAPAAKESAQPASSLSDMENLRALEQLASLKLRNKNGFLCIDADDTEGRTPPIRAILQDWAEGLKLLVAGGANLDEGRYQGRSARRFLDERPALVRALAGEISATSAASEQDGPEIVATLLRGETDLLARSSINPAILNYRDGKRWTVLHHAINRRQEAYSLRLIAAGAPLDALSLGGQTPLAFAAAQRMETIVAALLAAGASVNLREGDAPTPLFQAAFSQNPSLVKRLLDAGADLAVRVDDDGATVAHAAAERADNVPVLELLAAAGADLKSTTRAGRTLLDRTLGSDAFQNVGYLHKQGVRWSAKYVDGLSPLQYAAREGHVEMIRELLACGAWDEGAVPLATSPAAKALLEDAAVKRGSKVVDDVELWPVICADRVNGRARAEQHLANGGNVNFTPADGFHPTPLELALEAMNLDLARFLLERGAIPRTHRDGHYSVQPPTLWRVMMPFWLSHPEMQAPGSPRPFETTPEAWDAYAADMVKLMAARWPDPAYSKLHKFFLASKMPLAASALAAAGFETGSSKPTPFP